jgi:ribosomal-protein-alanine N-acetyltransferase
VKFTVRDFRPEDFMTLWQIDQSCFPEGIAYSQQELKSYIRRKTSFTLIAEHEPQLTLNGNHPGIIGFLVAEQGRTAGHIITIDVRVGARGNRVGSVLLENAEQRLCASGCKKVRLETAVDNLGALAFYKKHGYSVVGAVPGYYSNGLDALVLEKDLLSPTASE